MHHANAGREKIFPAPSGRTMTQKGLCFAYTSTQPSIGLSLEKRRVMEKISEPDYGFHLHFRLLEWSRVKEQTQGLLL